MTSNVSDTLLPDWVLALDTSGESYKLPFLNIYRAYNDNNSEGFDTIVSNFSAQNPYNETEKTGFDINTPAYYLSTEWQDAFTKFVATEKTGSPSLSTSTTSLQSLIQYDYLVNTNIEISKQLNDFSDYMQSMTTIMTSLAEIESLYNKKADTTITYNPTTDSSAAIDPVLHEAGGLDSTDLEKLFNARQALFDAAQLLPSRSDSTSSENLLYEYLTRIYTSIDTTKNLSYYNTTWSTSNDNATNLMNAQTSAETVNGALLQKLKKSLFVFEEFYRSASAIALTVSNLIKKGLQNI